jgi:hypothetical protein
LYGAERSTNITVAIVALELIKNSSNLLYSRDNNFSYSCKLNGATTGVENKRIEYQLFAQDNIYAPIKKWTNNLNIADTGIIQKTLNELPEHGIYILQV